MEKIINEIITKCYLTDNKVNRTKIEKILKLNEHPMLSANMICDDLNIERRGNRQIIYSILINQS